MTPNSLLPVTACAPQRKDKAKVKDKKHGQKPKTKSKKHGEGEGLRIYAFDTPRPPLGCCCRIPHTYANFASP